jgi:adenosylmethionine-8-amino-7-oxononanoate aminotransferase
MSLGDPADGMHRIFRGIVPDQIFVHPPTSSPGAPSMDASLSELRLAFERHHATLAAMVVEPIMQGAGGFHFYPAAYLVRARELCNEFGVLLIFDEVATGFGRTGKLFAAEHARVSPDIMVLGKGLTGGYFGMSATLASDVVYDSFLGDGDERIFMHGPTFMGHAIAASVARAGIEIFLREDYLSKIAAIESQLREKLLPIDGPGVVHTRVLGAVGVVEVDSPRRYEGLQAFALDRGVWLRPFARTVYTAPPYVIGHDELSRVVTVIRDWFARR